MAIKKTRKRAVVYGGDGSKTDAFFFLRHTAEAHSGRELIIDVLNSHAVFISVEQADNGEIVFLNKDKMVYLKLDRPDLPENLPPGLPEIRVRIEMVNGTSVTGAFFVDMPPERSRLSDYLNFTPRFIYLVREGAHLILNKAYIRLVREQGKE